MKVGFVLECSLNGQDATIYPDVLRKLCLKAAGITPKTLGDKGKMLKEGHIDVKKLFDDGCEYVFMIWDKKPGNCEEDKKILKENLANIKVNLEQVRFCCIEDMLESWLIADSRGINLLVEKMRPTHPNPAMQDNKTKAEQVDAGNRLGSYFRANRLGSFNSLIHSVKIYQNLPDLVKARKWNDSFNEYCNFIEEICV